MITEARTLKKQIRLEHELSKIKVKCSCSHIVCMPVYGYDYIICHYCGKRIYKNELIKFKDILLRKMRFNDET